MLTVVWRAVPHPTHQKLEYPLLVPGAELICIRRLTVSIGNVSDWATMAEAAPIPILHMGNQMEALNSLLSGRRS